MIQARHTYAGNRLARLYDGYMLGRAFRDIRIEGRAPEKGLPRLLLSNHFCWWDGFIQSRLNRCCLHRNLYVMMLEEQLRRFPLLASLGAFSVRPGSRSVIESLRYAARLLEDPRNMVLIFPQGKIQSAHTEYFHFGSGTDYLLKCLRNPIQILFNVNLTDYYSRRRPALNIYFKEAGTVIPRKGLSPRLMNMLSPGSIHSRHYTGKESPWSGNPGNRKEGHGNGWDGKAGEGNKQKGEEWNTTERNDERRNTNEGKEEWDTNKRNDKEGDRNEWNTNERNQIGWNTSKRNRQGHHERKEDGLEQDGFKQKEFKQDGHKPVPVPSPLETEFNRFAARCRALQDHRYR